MTTAATLHLAVVAAVAQRLLVASPTVTSSSPTWPSKRRDRRGVPALGRRGRAGAAVASSPPLTVAWPLASPAGARTVITGAALYLDVAAAVGAVLARGVAYSRLVRTTWLSKRRDRGDVPAHARSRMTEDHEVMLTSHGVLG